MIAASTERTRLLELFQMQTNEGPCPECFHTGQPVAIADLHAARDRWPLFVSQATQAGFRATHAPTHRDLQTALNSRIVIEQAKGVIAERHQVDMSQAFVRLRNAARDRNQRLSDLARTVVEGAELS